MGLFHNWTNKIWKQHTTCKIITIMMEALIKKINGNWLDVWIGSQVSI